MDADAIVHQYLRDPHVLSEIQKKIETSVLMKDGSLNRKALAQIVFGSIKKRRVLEKILHPLVRDSIFKTLKTPRCEFVVIDIPLLYESNWQKFFDAILVVNTNMKNRLTRLKNKGVSIEDAKRRIKAQMSLSEKVKRADFVIDNNESLKKTKKQVDEIWTSIQNHLPTANHPGGK